MELTSDDLKQIPEVAAFGAELRYWRELAGVSQKDLARATGYGSSYVSKSENAALAVTRQFAETADQHLHAGRAIIRHWRDMHEALVAMTKDKITHRPAEEEPPPPGPDVVVEHEIAELVFRDGVYTTHIRRQLRNTGTRPVTRYLIRIVVDHYPGDAARSNEFYRHDPLTWDEISLAARCDDEPMTWDVKHDRDASKEVWLLFENQDGKFPLYPGETAWISYQYSVAERHWGWWWARAIRVPTRRISITLVLPTRLNPQVWGIKTSMTAEATPFDTPILRQEAGQEATFTWSAEDPPLHARYRIEWNFRSFEEKDDAAMPTISASEQMQSIGIVQEGDPILTGTARLFDLPAEADDARRVIGQLVSSLERVAQVHNFVKGMGLAAPQIGIGRAAAVVRTPDGQTITLLNPRICDESAETDEQYEGCLSFFDVRGKVPRPLGIEVEHTDVDGNTRITVFERGMARLVGHEVDHLIGVLYRSRMRPGIEPIPVSEYQGTGRRWNYA